MKKKEGETELRSNRRNLELPNKADGSEAFNFGIDCEVHLQNPQEK